MMARQATAAVMVSMDDTAVFVTVVGQKKAKPGQDFFPPVSYTHLDVYKRQHRVSIAHCSRLNTTPVLSEKR